MGREAAVELLARSPVIHLAATDPHGAPILRTLHSVVIEGRAVAFHGSPSGEKMLALGRPVVLSAEEAIASIPSYWVDPERACPATTYYRSVQVHGLLEPVEDRETRAAILQAFMAKYQPEGGHVPISADLGLYRAAVAGLGILQVSLEDLDGKAKLGQNRRPAELARILQKLWERGLPGDPRAIDRVQEANPDAPIPEFLQAPAGLRFVCAPGPEDAADVARALAHPDAYWNQGVPAEILERVHLSSSAWVIARDKGGKLAATARAVSDRGKFALVLDVFVAPVWRGRGLGKAIVRLLLDHPAVRDVRKVTLRTRDAQGLYERLGFVARAEGPPPPWPSTEMVLSRGLARQ